MGFPMQTAIPQAGMNTPLISQIAPFLGLLMGLAGNGNKNQQPNANATPGYGGSATQSLTPNGTFYGDPTTAQKAGFVFPDASSETAPIVTTPSGKVGQLTAPSMPQDNVNVSATIPGAANGGLGGLGGMPPAQQQPQTPQFAQPNYAGTGYHPNMAQLQQMQATGGGGVFGNPLLQSLKARMAGLGNPFYGNQGAL